MPAWPRRPVPRRGRSVPLPKGRTEHGKQKPAPPGLVPRTVGEAWLAMIILVSTGTAVLYMLLYSIERWLGASVAPRIAYGALAISAAFTLILFLTSFVVYVVPAAFGVRRR